MNMADITAIHFSQPIWLYIMLVFIVSMLLSRKISITYFLQRLELKYTYYHPRYLLIKDIIRKKNQSHSSFKKFLDKIAYLAILSLLFIALAAPYKTGEKLPDPPANHDIAFLVDNEISMVLKDYFIDKKRVNRLTMVKSVLLNFVNKLSGNRISLITFSEEAHTLLPFTTDSNLVKAMIPRIEATLTGRTSNPQKALLYTLNYLHNIQIDNTAARPSIVLITDVLRPPRDIDPQVVARYIKQQGYKLYVVAIGSNTYSKSNTDNSTLIYHPASFKRLKTIAKAANGEFYWAKNTASLNGIIQTILNTGKTKIKTEPEYIKIPLFQWPLGLFLILIIVQYLASSFSFGRYDV